MSTPDSASSALSPFTRFLSTKAPIDDRALDVRLWELFAERVKRKEQPHVLEAGCGIGTMLERLVRRRVLTTGHYLGIDLEAENIREALARTPVWAAQDELSVNVSHRAMRLGGAELSIEARFDHRDILNDPEPAGSQDVLLAHAFLDLVDLPTALDRLLPSLRPGGIFYFTLVFDGLTIFEPQIDPALDSEILRAYHETMDRRLVAGKPSGDSRSGRHLFALLRESGAKLLEAGSSDWIVFPREGRYSPEDYEFMKHILQTIEAALDTDDHQDRESLHGWVAERRDQLQRSELTYIAHQLDFLGQVSESSP